MGGEREETQYDNRVIIDIELLQYMYDVCILVYKIIVPSCSQGAK